MPIKFTKRILDDRQTTGQISTITDLSVWLCKAKKWASVPPVVIRNALLFGLHPSLNFCIGEIPKTETNARALDPFKPSSSETYFLDLASNSRTHGRFTFCQTPVGKFYCGEDWKRIIYGSILHTGCKKMVYKPVKYVVVDDENRDSEGNPLDDPTNNRHWQTGDSHAKASRSLMMLLGLPLDLEGNEVDPQTPIQFRMAEWKKWIGKGTIAYNPELDNSGVDLVIPHSSLKGVKPALGNYEGKLLMGLVFEAEERRAKPGWMLFQWFDFATLEADNIISRLKEKCERLSRAYNSITELAEILRIDQSIAEAELEEGSDKLQSEAEYENTMMRIIQADQRGLLLLHPYVVRRVKERLQALWLNLGKAAGVRFFSLMAQPDESLAHYHSVLPDGRIIGRRVFCAPDFEPGEYIVFCNPMRHWGDCQLWENRHEGIYTNSTGIMAAPRLLLLNLGRDTDGDFVQLIKSNAYPNMREAIANFSQSPIVDKLPKVALTGNLQQIAIRSMNDLTGVVASLLGRARAAGAEQIVLLIPPGGEQKEAREMKIIDFLSQELQIAVDSLKSAYPNNVAGLDAVKKFLDELGAESPWLKDFKDPACYRDRPCAVDTGAGDTISRLVQTVNTYWKAPDLKIESSPRTYENVLFGDVPHSAEQFEYAMDHRTRYRADMAKAIAWKDENEGDTRLIREVAEATKASSQSILETPKSDGSFYGPLSWVSAYWKAAHQAETGDAGLVFMIFGNEVIAYLKEMKPQEAKVIVCYGCQYSQWSPQGWYWSGQEVQTRAYLNTSRQKLAIEMKLESAKRLMGFHHLGLVGEKSVPYLKAGETRTMKIYSTRAKNSQTTEVTLFDPTLTQEEINNFLNFR
ncbi:MAG: hypothetical protein KME19_10990 [Microcoleus vaginatus WJT46-NPBG5]|jgi:hypothetical protein|nr:hypothetical protein [Microcoleus vaginatus WJT46-NPBG5]